MSDNKRRAQQRVAVLGYYGFGNFGDDLFNECIADIFLDARLAGYKVEFPASSSQKCQRSALLPHRLLPLWRSSGVLSAILRRIVLLLTILRADIILYAGGSLFKPGRRLAVRDSLIRFASLLGKPSFAVGVSMGPAFSEADRTTIRESANSLAALGVRDVESLAYADPRSTSLVGDLVLGMAPIVSEPQAGVLGVALHDPHYETERGKILSICAGARHVIVVSLDPEKTTWVHKLTQDLEEAGKTYEILNYTGDTGAVMRSFGRCQAIVTSRLHGGLAAALSGRPFALFPYEAKCLDVPKMIDYRFAWKEDMSLEDIESSGRVQFSRDMAAHWREKQVEFIQTALSRAH